MEKLVLKIECALVLLVLVVPPIVLQFFQGRVDSVRMVYSAPVFFMGLFAIALYLQVRGRFLLRFHGRWTLFKVIVLSGEGLKAFGFLCVISALLLLAGQLFGIDSGIVRVVRPDSPVLWCNFFLGTLLAVFYEEVVYRLYLPEMFRLLIPKLSPVLSEAAAVFFFALGHVYLGVLGFLNALGCGIALRLCIRKTHSIWFSFVAHAVYNFGSFFFLLLQS